MGAEKRLYFLDNLRTFLIFLVVLYHAGGVYEASGLWASFWVVDDPSTSVLPGILNLMMDIFIMPTLFFVSGYFAPVSLASKGPGPFLKARFNRLIIPWLLAVFTLVPLYKVLFLYSRGLAQEHWTTYFHFSNNGQGMNWLWFLPLLFIFNCLYVGLSKLNLPKLTLKWAVLAVFLFNLGYSVAIGTLGWIGWTKTPLFDFQNERLLPYFLVFLLGGLCYRLKVFDGSKKKLALYITAISTAWIPMNLYIHTLINFFTRPGEYFFSQHLDRLLLWIGFHVSLLALLYCMVVTFRKYFNGHGKLGSELNKLSYNVYIIHVIVMGLMATALLGTDLPAVVKYLILALATWVGSNLIAYAYARTLKGLGWRN